MSKDLTHEGLFRQTSAALPITPRGGGVCGTRFIAIRSKMAENLSFSELNSVESTEFVENYF